ncbi:MAG: DNA polymerase III subunit gamma/tau, partial [Candidatus Kerfeldbacteria bacterium]|nr:DNA polymerase III subunit gamma/tau [Candidatus Kerfeldbacteria bacterium]
MTETIYRKHRPQTFAEVVGQDHIKQTLQSELVNNKLAHAYLFCGMRGIGKTTVARLLAKAVNCEQRKASEFEPCNQCQSCLDIATGRSLDLIELDAASNRRIDDIREIREKVPYGTARSRYKVVIVDEVHMLTTEAFNALLKTLEEPPSHVIFILATTEVHKLPETIVSRCQRFDFKRITASVLKARLATIAVVEKVKIEDGVLAEIAYLANGSSRDAESYLGKILSLGQTKIGAAEAHLVLPHSDIKAALEFVVKVVNYQAAEAVELLNKFLSEGGEINYFYKQVLELWRHLLLLKLGGQTAVVAGLDYDEAVVKPLIGLLPHLSYGRLQNILGAWLEIEGEWRQAEVYQLPLEMAVITMCELAVTESKIVTHQTGPVLAGGGFVDTKPVKNNSETKNLAADDDNTAVKADLQEIINKWELVVNKIRDYNHSLSFILSVAKPVKLEKGKLTIEFQYKLHHERVKEKKIKQVVEDVIKEIS